MEPCQKMTAKVVVWPWPDLASPLRCPQGTLRPLRRAFFAYCEKREINMRTFPDSHIGPGRLANLAAGQPGGFLEIFKAAFDSKVGGAKSRSALSLLPPLTRV